MLGSRREPRFDGWTLVLGLGLIGCGNKENSATGGSGGLGGASGSSAVSAGSGGTHPTAVAGRSGSGDGGKVAGGNGPTAGVASGSSGASTSGRSGTSSGATTGAVTGAVTGNSTGAVSGGGNTGAAGGAGKGGAGGAGGQSSTGGVSPSASACPAGAQYPALSLGKASSVTTGTGSGLFEGTVWIPARGVLLFSDINFNGDPMPSTLRELTPPSASRSLIANSGTNGLALTPDGKVVGAAHDVQGVVLIDPSTGAKTTLVSKYQGKSFNSPNDITVRSDGMIYFTDPDSQLGSRTSQTGVKGVYRVTADGQQVTLVDDTLSQPNGIALSPDEKTLYVAAMKDNKIVRYAVAADGSTSDRQDFVTVTEPDGMGVDCAGNIYAASHTPGVVQVFAPSGGAALTTLTVAAKATNIAFGGTDRKTLYISAGKAIFSATSNIPGFPN